MDLKEQIDLGRLPRHVAVIMDGNGRWAKGKGRERIFGHRNAIEAVRATTEAAAELGIEYLTLYAFSTENWKRPKLEVSALMHLLVNTIDSEMKTLMDNKIRLATIGEVEQLPKSTYRALQAGIEKTRDNDRMTLILALNYSGKWDIARAARRLAERVAAGEMRPDEIDAGRLSQELSTASIPDPEFMIRTSGEHRISNFLLWQFAYTEFFFSPVYWPDFRKQNLYEALLDYQRRERRFGKISDQLTT
jgi:undecaprenyl diphosphate synthase